MSDFKELSLRNIAEKLRNGDVSSLDLVEFSISHDSLNAYRQREPGLMRRQAKIADAKTIWIKKSRKYPDRYIIGLSYRKIAVSENRRIVRYAWMRYLLPRITSALLVLMILSLITTSYYNLILTQENQRVAPSYFLLYKQPHSEELQYQVHISRAKLQYSTN